MTGLEADAVKTVTSTGAEGDLGVPAGDVLRTFARAALGDGDLARARAGVVGAVGEEAMFDAAAVIAFFDAINRIADGTGTQLEAALAANAATLLGGLDLEGMRKS